MLPNSPLSFARALLFSLSISPPLPLSLVSRSSLASLSPPLSIARALLAPPLSLSPAPSLLSLLLALPLFSLLTSYLLVANALTAHCCHPAPQPLR